MGERAFDGPASEEDLRAMEREVRQSIRAGAIGFTSSRSPSHETPEGRLVASRNATWEEVRRLVNAMGELNAGLFEIAGEGVDRKPATRRARLAYAAARPRGRVEGRSPFGCSTREPPGTWKKYLDLLDETAAMGGRMFAQAHSRSLGALLVQDADAFDRLPIWKDIRKLPLAEQAARLRDPELRPKLVQASSARDDRRALGTEARQTDYDKLYVFDTVEGPHRTVADVARERGQHPAETMIELAPREEPRPFFLMPVANEDQDVALESCGTRARCPPSRTPARTSRSSWTLRSRRTSCRTAHKARVHPRAGGAHADVRAGDALGLPRPRADPGKGWPPTCSYSIPNESPPRCRKWWTICRQVRGGWFSVRAVSP